jgi:prophage DNA circulation protein
VFSRIVVEAKNKALTKSEWEKEAAGSKENRAATGFLGMCKNLNDMPNGSRVLILDEQSIVIAFDPEIDDPNLLGLVYQMVRMATLSSSGQLDEVNIAEVNRALDDALKALDKFDSITKSAAAVKNSADSIIKEANSIRTSIGSNLGIAQSAISRGLEPEALESATALELE